MEQKNQGTAAGPGNGMPEAARQEKPINPQRPSVGRMVHVGSMVPGGGLEPLAAVITKVHQTGSDVVNLRVLPAGGGATYGMMGVYWSPTLRSAMWSWPPRV